MGNPATWSVAADAGIAAGALVAIAITILIVKHYIDKRKAKRDTEIKNEQRAMQMNSRENLVGEKLGVDMSALERGYSRAYMNSRASSYVLAPAAAVVDWGDSKSILTATKSIQSESSSITDLPESNEGSVVSFPGVPKKPSPLRLNPSDAPFSRMSTVSSFGGSYMPPLPPRSSLRPQINPLDIHFSISRPTTPQSPSLRPASYFPSLPQAKNALFVPTPAGSIGDFSSEAASMVSSNTPSASPEPNSEPPPPESPTFDFNFFDADVPTRPLQLRRSISPTTSDNDRPLSRLSIKASNLDPIFIPSLRTSTFGPISRSFDLDTSGERAIIRDSLVSKRSVSIYSPNIPPTPTKPLSLSDSHSPSSIYSRASSIISNISRPISPTEPNPQQPIHSHSRSRSTSRRPQSISRTRDSIRRLSRHSLLASRSEKRRSRDRDSIHYDPSSHLRNRSGSVQGRSVDFDRPRESPFSSANTHPSHSATPSDAGSIPDNVASPWKEEPVPRPGGLTVVRDQDRLSVATVASQSSSVFGGFYDSYYRQTPSQMSHVNADGSRRSSVDAHRESSNGGGKRPPPLRFGSVGMGVEETIVEVASPVPSPMVGRDRFPSRV